MEVREAGRRTLRLLGEAKDMERPVGELVGAEGHWEKAVSAAFDRRAATAVGPMRLGAGLTAVVHLTRGAEAPIDAFTAGGADGEAAFASLALAGSAEEAPTAKVPLGRPGVLLAAGLDAGGAVAFTHHRPCRLAEPARDALAGLLGHLVSPWDVEAIGALADGEALVLEASGSVAVRADAGWSAVLLRRVAALDRVSSAFSLAAPVVLETGVKAGVRVAASLAGRLRVVVTRGARPGHARVRLLRRGEDLVGLGLKLAASADLENGAAFAAAVVGRVFTVPDGLAGEVRGLLASLDEVAAGIAEVDARARRAIARAVGGDPATVSAAEIADGAAGLGALAGRNDALARVAERLARAATALLAARSRLERFVDEAFAATTLPLSEARRRLAGWLASYDALREEVGAHLERATTARISAELAAGVNRAATHEALLDVEVRLADRADAYLALLAGNWLPALEAMRAGGANGVEVGRSALVDVVRCDRNLALRIDLVGRATGRELGAWTELRVERDRPGAALALVAGTAGATLEQRLPGAVEEASVVFDLAAAALAGHGLPRLEVTARITRALTIDRPAAIAALLPVHLAGARALGRLDGPRAAALLAALLAEAGAYTFAFDLAVPGAAARRALLVDVEADERELRRRAWAAFLAAARLADQPLPGAGRRVRLLSACVTAEMCELLTTRPGEVFDVVFARRAPFTALPRATEVAAWLHLLQAHAFIAALLAARAAVRARRDAQSIAHELAALASRARDQVGAVAGATVEAKYLMLARLAGPEACTLTVTFSRGSVAVTV